MTECTDCGKRFHAKCSNLGADDLLKIETGNSDWYCTNCKADCGLCSGAVLSVHKVGREVGRLLDRWVGKWLPYLLLSLLTYLSSNRPTYLPTQQPTYQHTNPSIYLPSHLPTCVPTYQHSYLPTYLHTYLPAYLLTNKYITLLELFLSYPTLPFLVPIEVRFGMSWSLFSVRFGTYRSPFRYLRRSVPVRFGKSWHRIESDESE